ncbi:MAG: tRNA 2-thiouridine(34) synthase MnmA [Thermodesulfobacteriota bacterium]|nr:MAG: tRNA 2-thiouridine(34) synthase MnmA [Thermodesulfobacteriota bacterium]
MKICVALSGGIDSAVAAYLLKEKGYNVIGLTFEIFDSQKEEIEKAKKIAQKLKISHFILDLKEIFNEEIIKYFIKDYSLGKTPNPCALCNRKIKFGKVLEYSIKELGCDKFATGHYVRLSEYKGHILILRAKDTKKDQSYFLSLIKKEALQKLIFPLSELTKDEVKNKAQALGINVEKKQESRDICFLKGKSLKDFLSHYIPEKKGPIVYKNQIVGFHSGIYWFTIGQRKGLKIPLGKPLYIIDINAKKNEIILGEEKELYSKGLILEDLNFHLPLKVWTNPVAQIRYRTQPVKVKDIQKLKNGYLIIFEKEVKSVTPGQLCSFYEENFLLGGGIIKSKY